MQWLYIKYFVLPRFKKDARILEIGDGLISKRLEKLDYQNYYIVGDRKTIRKNIKSPFIYTIDHQFDDESFDLILISRYESLAEIYNFHNIVRFLKKGGYFFAGYKLCQK